MTNQGQRLIGVALVLGVAAAVAGYFGLHGAAERTAAGQRANLRDVVVSVTDLTFGTKLESTMLRIAHYPKDAVPEGAYAHVDSVVGQTTKVFMAAREPVTAIKLSSRGGGLSMLVRPKMRAASIEVNQVSGVSGFVLPGDRVDVLITVNPRHDEDAVTRTLLQNIEVLAAGQKTQQQDNKPINVQAVTLLVDPAGAEVLAHAGHEGEISLVLRNPGDDSKEQVPGLSTREMLGGSIPTAVPTAAPKRRPTVTPVSTPPPGVPVVHREPPKIRIIRDASVTETPAFHDSTPN
ncbi:MAG: Flp pilus assembly protein CpaB [Candidatus Eisenbacteria bacterium]|uniref:Flp pilus assembly protein CpaB n=1 Tax=Eiseniibacteriota bacterium TaxID=2212470 RepID=A0A538SY54_UNCEI|nr:MAG: Flp pilus assembly protein CpaB [Candidatus Eisenbacteria bacterium]